MSANGQNPSCSQTRTESTKVWFGWWVSYFSKVSMSILQTILNRSSQSIIIACLTQLFSATGLGHGNGLWWVNTQLLALTLLHWFSTDIFWHTSVSCPSHNTTQAFLLTHSFSACPSLPHLMQTCLYWHLDACFPHFPWLNNQHGSLLCHVDTPPHCPANTPCWFPCAIWSPATLLKTCCTLRNLNFLNWSSDTLLTDPDQWQIALSRLRMQFCSPALADAKKW